MRKALVIGIGSYRHPLPPLKGSIPDAEEVSERLKHNNDGTLNFHVKTCFNLNTASELRLEIRDLFAHDNEVSLLYFAGHGTRDELGGYLVTPDYESGDPGLSMDDVLKMVLLSRARNKIIILDCCNAGHFGNFSPVTTASNIPTGTVIMASTTDNDVAKETKGHGIFTNLLLSALDGGAADLNGYITPGSIYAYIDQAMNVWGQRPVFKTNVVGFVHLRKTARQVPLDIMKNILLHFPNPNDEFSLNPSFEYTNNPNIAHKVEEPFADEKNVKRFKELQKLQSVGIVEPVDELYMYFAAMNSKSCRLTSLGKHYWQLVKENKF